MESIGAGELVKVADDGSELDGIVFDTPSSSKVIVAVVDRARGPVFRTVHPNTLSVRTEEGHDDRALRLLVRRTPPPVHGAARAGSAGGRGQGGHPRGAAHPPAGQGGGGARADRRVASRTRGRLTGTAPSGPTE